MAEKPLESHRNFSRIQSDHSLTEPLTDGEMHNFFAWLDDCERQPDPRLGMVGGMGPAMPPGMPQSLQNMQNLPSALTSGGMMNMNMLPPNMMYHHPFMGMSRSAFASAPPPISAPPHLPAHDSSPRRSFGPATTTNGASVSPASSSGSTPGRRSVTPVARVGGATSGCMASGAGNPNSAGEVPEELQLTDKRSRNKIAAEKYRKKKREEQEKTASRADTLHKENDMLRARIAELEAELQGARDALARTQT